MAGNKNPKNETVQLLQEGAGSYNDAMVALMAFRHEVHKRCTRAVLSQLAELGNAIGITIKKDDVQPCSHDFPDDICVRILTSEMRKAGIELYVGLSWWKDDEGERCFGVYAGFWVKPRARERVEALVGEENSKRRIWQDDDGIYIGCKMSPDEAGSIDEKLGVFVREWISIGKKCGGLMSLLVEDS